MPLDFIMDLQLNQCLGHDLNSIIGFIILFLIFCFCR